MIFGSEKQQLAPREEGQRQSIALQQQQQLAGQPSAFKGRRGWSSYFTPESFHFWCAIFPREIFEDQQTTQQNGDENGLLKTNQTQAEGMVWPLQSAFFGHPFKLLKNKAISVATATASKGLAFTSAAQSVLFRKKMTDFTL